MPVQFDFMDQRLQTWLMCHQTYDSVFKCEESVFSKFGLSTQKHAVMMALKYIEGPVTVTELANWLDRNQNGISALVERMVKDGLITRKRDLTDRRAARLVMTKKGRDLMEQATISGWKLVQDVLSGLSDEDLRALNNILGKMRSNAFEYLNPGKVMDTVKTDEAKNMPRFLARVKEQEAKKR